MSECPLDLAMSIDLVPFCRDTIIINCYLWEGSLDLYLAGQVDVSSTAYQCTDYITESLLTGNKERRYPSLQWNDMDSVG